MNTNSITICGNVVRDPELRHTSNGTPTTNFGVAVNRRVYGRSETPNEVVTYFNVVAWNSLAENICESIPKGARVTVVGRIDQRSWEVAGEPGRRTAFELVAEDVGISMKFSTATIQKVQRQFGHEAEEMEITVVVPDSPEDLMSTSRSGVEEPF